MKHIVPRGKLLPTILNDELPTPFLKHRDWRGHIGAAMAELLGPPPAFRIGERVYRVGDNPQFLLTETEDDVLSTLISLGGAASITQLRKKSKVDAPHKVLRQIEQNYSQLRPYLTFPPNGKKNQGGYGTTIRASKN